MACETLWPSGSTSRQRVSSGINKGKHTSPTHLSFTRLPCPHLRSAMPAAKIFSRLFQFLTPKKDRISCSALALGPHTSDKSRPSLSGAGGILLFSGRSLLKMAMTSVQLYGPAKAKSRSDWTVGSRSAAICTLAVSRTSIYHSIHSGQ